MERAREGARVALVIGTDLVAAMRTAIEQQIDLALLVAGHDDGLRADRLDHEVVRLRHLALVPDIDPGAVPDVLQLSFEDRGIAVERAVYPVRPDQFAPLRRARHDVHRCISHGLARTLLRRPAAWVKN